MRKLKTTVAAGLAAAGLLLAVGSGSANAYGFGSWKAAPSGCNEGVFYGESWWEANTAKAYTTETNNFCWIGNVKVAVAIHDNWATNRGPWVVAANYAYQSYPASYHSGWGGWHSWGDSGGRTT